MALVSGGLRIGIESFASMVVLAGSLLFSATLKDAAGLKAVLDLVDKDFSQDAGKHQSRCLLHLCCML